MNHTCWLRRIALAIVLLPIAILAADEPKEILLWPNGAPGSEGRTEKEIVEKGTNGERKVWSIHNPSITPYLPAKGKATGAAVIIAPGGAHRFLCVDHEGYNVAQWLSEHPLTALLLDEEVSRWTKYGVSFTLRTV